MSNSLHYLLERVSIPANLLAEPIPNNEQLEQIIQAAVCAPDHGMLRPWRFLTIAGGARNKLGELFCQAALQDNPDLREQELDNIRQKPLRSPLIIAVIAAVKPHPKIPEHEQVYSAAAAAQNLSLASNALGFGAIWLTGPFATNPYVCEQLGVVKPECIVGFMYLGTPVEKSAMIREKKLQSRPNAADFIKVWDR